VSYNIGGYLLPHVDAIRDEGVNIDHSLAFSSHCRHICSKANARANLILRCFRTKCVDVLLNAFKVYIVYNYVRPLSTLHTFGHLIDYYIHSHAGASSEALQ